MYGQSLIIDDEKQILGLLSTHYRFGREYEVLQAATCKAGREADGATFARGGIVRCVLAGW